MKSIQPLTVIALALSLLVVFSMKPIQALTRPTHPTTGPPVPIKTIHYPAEDWQIVVEAFVQAYGNPQNIAPPDTPEDASELVWVFKQYELHLVKDSDVIAVPKPGPDTEIFLICKSASLAANIFDKLAAGRVKKESLRRIIVVNQTGTVDTLTFSSVYIHRKKTPGGGKSVNSTAIKSMASYLNETLGVIHNPNYPAQ